MTKQPCELIEDLLPLYLEDGVSVQTKKIVEEHLQECSRCHELCNQFKNPEPLLPDLKESLPEADTFKRWLKRLKIGALMGVGLAILVGVGIGVVSYRAGNVAKKDILTVNDVVNTVEKGGLALTPDATLKPSDYKIGDTEPRIYKLAKEDGNLFVYQFTSIGARETEFGKWEENNRPKSGETNSDMFSTMWQYDQAYAAKNTVIVFTLSQIPNVEYMTTKLVPMTTNLGKVIFYNLNGGQQIVYQGESEHWQGKIVVNYYNHFWTDDKGALQDDGWNHVQPVLEFKGDPSTIMGEFSFEVQSPVGGGFGGTNSDGFRPNQFDDKENSGSYGGVRVGMGGISGNGAVPLENSVFTITVKWNNKQETFDLKALPQNKGQ